MAQSNNSDAANRLLASAGVPAYKCPPGTKMHLLDLGSLEADEGWLVESVILRRVEI